MHRPLLALLAFAQLPLFPGTCDASIVETVQRVLPLVVSVETERRSGWARKQIVGAGVIVDARGIVLTARHVIDGAESIAIRLYDDTRTPGARVTAEDTATDLALVSFAAPKPLQAVVPDLSRKPRLGETVIAIGHPFGYLHSVTRGIVGGLNRMIDLNDGPLKHMIQTDAAIDKGSSGGPLFAGDGRWIGLVTAVREHANTMGFAVPAEPIAAFLKQHVPGR